MHLKTLQNLAVFSHDSYLLEYNGLFNHFGYLYNIADKKAIIDKHFCRLSIIASACMHAYYM